LVVRRIFRRIARRFDVERRPLVNLGAETAWFTVISPGIVIGLGTMGVDVTALVPGLGLTGFALGFALRDAVSTLLAGILIILYQPFQVGDRIEVDVSAGTVVGIDLHGSGRRRQVDPGAQQHAAEQLGGRLPRSRRAAEVMTGNRPAMGPRGQFAG
jgi:Mechanosensitive ion channel